MNPELLRFLYHILEYQRIHHIKNRCLDNVMLVYDTLKLAGVSVSAKAVYYTWYDSDTNTFGVCHGHLVLMVDDGRLEVSYEFLDKPLRLGVYANTLKELIEVQPPIKHDKQFVSNCLKNHTHFCNLAKRINLGELIVSDREYYHKLADYVEKKLKSKMVDTNCPVA